MTERTTILQFIPSEVAVLIQPNCVERDVKHPFIHSSGRRKLYWCKFHDDVSKTLP